jgi:hypothetical protein
MHLRKASLLSLILLSFLVSTAQNVVTDTSATAVAYWKKGEQKVYTLLKKSEKKSNQRLQKDSSSFQLTVTVLEESNEHYLLEWRYKTLYMPQMNGTNIIGIEALCNNLRIVYRTDANGSFMELVNMDEVLSFIDKAYDATMANYKYTPEMETVVNEFRRLIKSRESVEQILLKDVQVFHNIYGLEFNSRKQTEEGELPNMFGGDPLPAKSTYQFMRFDKLKNQIHINIELLVDSDAATRIITDFINATGKKLGKKDSLSAADLPKIDIHDTNRFVLDQSTGWLRSASSERFVDAVGAYKKETTRFISN